MIYTLKNEHITAKFDSFGAQMISVVKDGKERLWQNEDGSWDGHAITLFPFCSNVQVWVDGKFYPNVIHGFGYLCKFDCIEKTESSVAFRLTQREETKTHYPYDFRLDIKFELDKNSVRITHSVYNPMDIPLPYAVGSHESYAIDKPIDGYYLEFEKDEHFFDKSYESRNSSKGYKDMGSGRTLMLKNEYFKNDSSLLFTDMKSRYIKLCKSDGTEVAKVEFDEIFRDFVFWKTETGSYICLEPWMNVCDLYDDEKKIEFSKKRGIFSVEPHKTDEHSHTVTYY